MPETERQRTERILREMLAQAKAGETDDIPDDLTIAALVRRSVWARRAGQFYRTMQAIRPPRLPRIPAFASGSPREDRAAARRLSASRMKETFRALFRPQAALAMAAGFAGPASRRVLALSTGSAGSDAALDEIFSAAREAPPETARLPRERKFERIDPVMSAVVPGRDRNVQPVSQFSAMKKDNRRSDFAMAVCGVVLGLTCAMFPWYIFFNQEQFGVQGISFGGRGHNSGRIVVDPRPSGDTPVATQDAPKNLDIFSTGTLQQKAEEKDKAPGLDQQPFPEEAPTFRLVHVANGRAMIEDDAGLWIVQPGSTLPDSSLVKSIEQRKGKWVLVTSTDRVIEISK